MPSTNDVFGLIEALKEYAPAFIAAETGSYANKDIFGLRSRDQGRFQFNPKTVNSLAGPEFRNVYLKNYPEFWSDVRAVRLNNLYYAPGNPLPYQFSDKGTNLFARILAAKVLYPGYGYNAFTNHSQAVSNLVRLYHGKPGDARYMQSFTNAMRAHNIRSPTYLTNFLANPSSKNYIKVRSKSR